MVLGINSRKLKGLILRNVNFSKLRCLSFMMLMFKTFPSIMRIKWLLLSLSSTPLDSQIPMTDRRYMISWMKMMSSGKTSRLKFLSKRPRFRTWRSDLLLLGFSSNNRSLVWAQRWSWHLKHWSDKPIKNREELISSRLKRENSTRSLKTRIEKSKPSMRQWSISKRLKRKR